MLPEYANNDYLLIAKYWWKPLSVGNDIVCQHSSFGFIFKRIKAIKKNCIDLTGLNALSTQDEYLKNMPKDHFVGRVIWHIT